MSTSNVQNIESLESFHSTLVRLSQDWDRSLQEVRALIGRADQYFAHEPAAYWRRQLELADRECREAKDSLSAKRSSTRPADRPAATEALRRVQLAEQRVRLCQEKIARAKSISIEIGRACDALLGPLAEITEHCEVVLPAAARELRVLIQQLRLYAHQTRRSS